MTQKYETPPKYYSDTSPQLLIFTDMDGSLLDHFDYSADPAIPLLRALESQGIPVIPVTSKTASEVLNLRTLLANEHPFIVENGAAVCVPHGYFQKKPINSVEKDGYLRIENTSPRSHWLTLLAHVGRRYRQEYDNFHEVYTQLGASGISQLTGLDSQQAGAANCREYSEPIAWRGSLERRAQFIRELETHGATLLQGGRFLSLSGPCDKGLAVNQLTDLYRADCCRATLSLGIGDSNNDIAMLDRTDWALMIPAGERALPTLRRATQTLVGVGDGPVGWNQGVRRWLELINYTL